MNMELNEVEDKNVELFAIKDFFAFDNDVQKQAESSFKKQYLANPNLPFYGLYYEKNRPRIIASLKFYKKINRKVYTIFISKE